MIIDKKFGSIKYFFCNPYFYDVIINVFYACDDINFFFNNPIIIDSFSDFNSKLKNLISGIYLWKYFLYATLILIILEMYISNIYLYRKND